MRSDPTKRNVALYRVAVAVVLLSIVGAPALSATPRSDDAPRLVGATDPVALVGQWLDGVATGLASVWQQSSCRIDPDGAACTEGTTAPPSSVPKVETSEDLQSTGTHGR